MEERFTLIRDRIKEIENESVLTGELVLAFSEVAHFIMDVYSYYDEIASRGVLTAEEYEEWQKKLYEDEEPANYESSFLCPKYAVKRLGRDGGLFSAIYADLLGMRIWAAEKNLDMLTIFGELFVQIYCCYTADYASDPDAAYDDALEAYRSFYFDYMEDFAELSVSSQVLPASGVVGDILKNADLTDLSYL